MSGLIRSLRAAAEKVKNIVPQTMMPKRQVGKDTAGNVYYTYHERGHTRPKRLVDYAGEFYEKDSNGIHIYWCVFLFSCYLSLYIVASPLLALPLVGRRQHRGQPILCRGTAHVRDSTIVRHAQNTHSHTHVRRTLDLDACRYQWLHHSRVDPPSDAAIADYNLKAVQLQERYVFALLCCFVSLVCEALL
jgi:NADH:ubiquinone oxidoreductase subunit